MESEAVETFFISLMSRSICELIEDESMQHIDALMTQLKVFTTGGSGWVVDLLKRLEIKTVACGNVIGGSYIETPPNLKPLKNSILNVGNKTEKFAALLYCSGNFFRRWATS